MVENPRQRNSSRSDKSDSRSKSSNPPSLLGLQRALMALWDAPELRVEKVTALRHAAQSGRYDVSPEKIAEVMLNEWTQA